ncbi:MAG TPA: hypothetical protein PLE74_02390, partial [Candidatus Cloacimonadota bacterium]|nr:hypothetical protein [Candidatus Cloacimonadota bacterium]
MSAKMNVNSLYNLIKKHCEADDFQIRISEFESLETRFAQNRITQHIAGKNTDVSIQVAVGEKWGSARTNQIDEENILKTLHKAHCIALLNETDPEFQPSEPASKYIEYTNYYGSTQKLKVQDHIEIISQCIDNAVKKDATISGMTEHHLIERHLMTQNGFIGHNQESRFEHSMTMKKDDRETKVSRSVLDFTDFDLNYEIKQINEQFDSLTSPVVMEPGKYNVILRPNAVVELFMFMLYSFDLRDADDRMTPYTGQIGKEM